MTDRDFPTVADVLGMHTILIRCYGAAPGIRNPRALEAAFFPPQTGYHENIPA